MNDSAEHLYSLRRFLRTKYSSYVGKLVVIGLASFLCIYTRVLENKPVSTHLKS